jgi:hypothetical protein
VVLGHLGPDRGTKDHRVVAGARPGFTHRHDPTIAATHHHLHVGGSAVVLARASPCVVLVGINVPSTIQSSRRSVGAGPKLTQWQHQIDQHPVTCF